MLKLPHSKMKPDFERLNIYHYEPIDDNLIRLFKLSKADEGSIIGELRAFHVNREIGPRIKLCHISTEPRHTKTQSLSMEAASTLWRLFTPSCN